MTTAASLLVCGQLGCFTTPDRSLLSKNVGQKKPSLMDRMPLVGKKKSDTPEPYPNPVKIAATWTPDTLVQTGRTPTRGFGGRIFFYDEKSRPVPVEGTLTVHGFDDTADSPEEGMKRFVFTPEQFTRHFGQTDLGASYSIWIPWDAVGGDQKKISLVTSFQTVNGDMIQGIPATLLLPGKGTDLQGTTEVTNYSPQYQKYLAATQSMSSPSSGLTTTTIRRQRPEPTGLSSDHPMIAMPSKPQSTQVMANRSGTRSADLEMSTQRSGPTRSNVMPASVQTPIEQP